MGTYDISDLLAALIASAEGGRAAVVLGIPKTDPTLLIPF
jgi:hypothetical protein